MSFWHAGAFEYKSLEIFFTVFIFWYNISKCLTDFYLADFYNATRYFIFVTFNIANTSSDCTIYFFTDVFTSLIILYIVKAHIYRAWSGFLVFFLTPLRSLQNLSPFVMSCDFSLPYLSMITMADPLSLPDSWCYFN